MDIWRPASVDVKASLPYEMRTMYVRQDRASWRCAPNDQCLILLAPGFCGQLFQSLRSGKFVLDPPFLHWGKSSSFFARTKLFFFSPLNSNTTTRHGGFFFCESSSSRLIVYVRHVCRATLRDAYLVYTIRGDHDTLLCLGSLFASTPPHCYYSHLQKRAFL